LLLVGGLGLLGGRISVSLRERQSRPRVSASCFSRRERHSRPRMSSGGGLGVLGGRISLSLRERESRPRVSASCFSLRGRVRERALSRPCSPGRWLLPAMIRPPSCFRTAGRRRPPTAYRCTARRWPCCLA